MSRSGLSQSFRHLCIKEVFDFGMNRYTTGHEYKWLLDKVPERLSNPALKLLVIYNRRTDEKLYEWKRK